LHRAAHLVQLRRSERGRPHQARRGRPGCRRGGGRAGDGRGLHARRRHFVLVPAHRRGGRPARPGPARRPRAGDRRRPARHRQPGRPTRHPARLRHHQRGPRAPGPHPVTLALLALLALAASPAPPAPPAQTESDEYTRYELLQPGTGRFRILYEVTATTPGATRYYNPIRKGSVATDEQVKDRLTGKVLPFTIVSGKEARAGGVGEADQAEQYIAVELPRPVPADGGEVRLLIEKTYTDPKSYFVDAEEVVFSRSLGIKRNAIVLPAGYELVECNVPAQVMTEPDGRIAVSFTNTMPGEAAVVIR